MITKIGQPYPATLLKTNNATHNLFVYENITNEMSKSWDTGFYCLRSKQQNQFFDIYWDDSHNKLFDYYTNHHVVQHDKETRKQFVQGK